MEKQMRSPCGRVCGCEYGSKVCMFKRGYIWDNANHKWSRDENGNVHRTSNRQCDYEIASQMRLI